MEKVGKYQELTREIREMWGVKNMDMVPVVVGVLGNVTKKLGQWLKNWGSGLGSDCYRKLCFYEQPGC